MPLYEVKLLHQTFAHVLKDICRLFTLIEERESYQLTLLPRRSYDRYRMIRGRKMMVLGFLLRRTIFVCGFYLLVSGNSNGNSFDDSILFRLTWPGPDFSSSTENYNLESENGMILTTTENEKYHCTLPANTDNVHYAVGELLRRQFPQALDLKRRKKLETKNVRAFVAGGGLSCTFMDEDVSYNGPSALELLQPLFSQLSCSYRLEQYWTYELCHGKYIKQYHDEKDVTNSKKLYRQEFILGEYDMNQFVADVIKRKEEKPNDSKEQAKIPTKKIDAQNLPYLEVLMSGGTVCDLNGKARSTRVMYICYPESKHEIYSFEEISSCEYEMIVLTPLLCSHPDYRLKENVQNDIACRPLAGSPQRPLRLEQMELENIQQDLKRRKAKLLETIRERFSEQVKEETVKPTPSDPKLVKEFLTGEHCLNGGSGWWKFEYCHGKKVDQYHEEKDGKKTIINLGMWNKEKHLKWLEQNPHKRPKKGLSQKQVSHYYTGGSSCDVNGRQRQVEVKLKCKESATNVNAVSLYLLEPKPCEYILVVESSILCSFVEAADENGMFQVQDDIK